MSSVAVVVAAVVVVVTAVAAAVEGVGSVDVLELVNVCHRLGQKPLYVSVGCGCE